MRKLEDSKIRNFKFSTSSLIPRYSNSFFLGSQLIRKFENSTIRGHAAFWV